MRKINYWAVIVATLVTFAVSSLYYSPLGFGHVWQEYSAGSVAGSHPSAGLALGEIARTLFLACLLAYFFVRLGATGWKDALRLGLVLWAAFSATQWVGGIMWEHTPVALAALHAGDWLVKILLMALILGTWRAKPQARELGHA
jgi:Protein of unknown function (DUF1761)